jgi:hypothetical protein
MFEIQGFTFEMGQRAAGWGCGVELWGLEGRVGWRGVMHGWTLVAGRRVGRFAACFDQQSPLFQFSLPSAAEKDPLGREPPCLPLLALPACSSCSKELATTGTRTSRIRFGPVTECTR